MFLMHDFDLVNKLQLYFTYLKLLDSSVIKI